jgi:phosphomannomutase
MPDSVNTPELKVAISDQNKFKFIEQFKQHAKFEEGKISTLDGVRVDFDFGFGLVRASNTSPCLVLRFEADNETNLKRIQEMFRQKLLMIDPQLTLPF